MLSAIASCSPTGAYAYTGDLVALNGEGPDDPSPSDPALQLISSPLTSRLQQWRERLSPHPDQVFVNYVLGGLEHGFRIGYRGGIRLTAAAGNLHSARMHPEVIDNYISAKVKGGRMLGPFRPGAISRLHLSRMGVIPKGHTPGRWRQITDLSHPEE